MKRELVPNAQKIYIIAPIPRKYERTVTKIEDGEETKKTVTYEYNAYRYVYVYDISHTTGDPIPLQRQHINNDDMASFYEKLVALSHVPVFDKELTGSCDGYYDDKSKLIVLKKNLSLNDKAAVLLHELAHSLYDDFDYSQDRDQSEMFVESIAYIVADHFGLDTSRSSFPYVIKWAKGEPKKVIELGNKITKCANQFIEKIENFESDNINIAA